jgi:hypothetical protein
VGHFVQIDGRGDRVNEPSLSIGAEFMPRHDKVRAANLFVCPDLVADASGVEVADEDARAPFNLPVGEVEQPRSELLDVIGG